MSVLCDGFYAKVAPVARIFNSDPVTYGPVSGPKCLAAMNLGRHHASRRGIIMIDAMVYISVIGVVLVLAAAVFDKGMRASAGLQRNITDIERALKAGERWRADVRSATGAIRADQKTVTIPQKNGAIIYDLQANQVQRIGISNKPEVFLTEVKDSKMVEERRGNVVGWKWEVELEHRRKEARIRPLFTFMAAPGGAR